MTGASAWKKLMLCFVYDAGYDQFMNIVLDNTVEIVSPTEKNEIGMVVIRGIFAHLVVCCGVAFPEIYLSISPACAGQIFEAPEIMAC